MSVGWVVTTMSVHAPPLCFRCCRLQVAILTHSGTTGIQQLVLGEYRSSHWPCCFASRAVYSPTLRAQRPPASTAEAWAACTGPVQAVGPCTGALHSAVLEGGLGGAHALRIFSLGLCAVLVAEQLAPLPWLVQLHRARQLVAGARAQANR
jgi:hypothetical protein